MTVVFFHYGTHVFPANNALFGQGFMAGPIAVNYFYLLSGFIMAIAYFSRDNVSLNKKRYWIARFARIYPVYLIALLLVAIGQIGKDDFWIGLFLNITLLQSWFPGYALSMNSPGWSLSVEAFFYACFPFFLLFIQRYGLKVAGVTALATWIITQLIHIYWLNQPSYEAGNLVHEAIYYHPLMHINSFLLGVIAGSYFKTNYKRLKKQYSATSTAILIVTGIFIFILLCLPQPTKLLTTEINIALTNGLIAPFFLLFIMALGINTGIISKTFSLPIFVLLGEASYSLYILQRPVYGIFDRTIGNWIPMTEGTHFYLYLGILIMVSIASFKLFETPIRYWLRKKLPN